MTTTVVRNICLCTLAAASVAAAAFLAGCETESATSPLVQVSPESVALKFGQSQTFTATGANNYDWTLSSSAYGTLSSRLGASVIYTSSYDGGSTSPVVTLTVNGTMGASGTSDTWRAEATILHNGETGDLGIRPGSGVELSYGASQTYSAVGGDGAYTWSVDNTALAWLSTTSADTTTLTSKYTNSLSKTTNVFLKVESDGKNYTISVKLK